MPKKIDVNVSTLVDLKAELFRKQDETKGSKSSSTPLYIGKKAAFIEKEKAQRQNGEVQKRQQRILVLEAELREEESKLRLSREALETKAKLYDKLSNGQIPCPTESEDLNEDASPYLVNFEQKVHNARREVPREDRTRQRSLSPVSDNPDNDWVEYVDSLGRTRECLRKDLPHFVAADRRLQEHKSVDCNDHASTSASAAELMSPDMAREFQRQQWEKQTQDEVNHGPVHYQHVLRDEAWNHGVAYFAFSKDESTRQEQMKELEHLRKQTMEQRVRTEKLKEKRKRALDARLAKVRDRKKLKDDTEGELIVFDELDAADGTNDEPADSTHVLDNIPLPGETSNGGSVESSSLIKPALSKSVPTDASMDDEQRARHVRPWDLGKKTATKSQHGYIEERRSERHAEFAPPKFY